jgi:ribosomal protein L7Ae-like RNA K-turn-binding protein
MNYVEWPLAHAQLTNHIMDVVQQASNPRQLKKGLNELKSF